jgi:hypothetical protein
MFGTVTDTGTIAGTLRASGGPCTTSSPIGWTATLDPRSTRRRDAGARYGMIAG